jgi:hypothetical protein
VTEIKEEKITEINVIEETTDKTEEMTDKIEELNQENTDKVF